MTKCVRFNQASLSTGIADKHAVEFQSSLFGNSQTG
jgi:hypothetical protein